MDITLTHPIIIHTLPKTLSGLHLETLANLIFMIFISIGDLNGNHN